MIYIYAIDFEYDKNYLSDFGFIVCNFNSSNGAVEASAGSVISFNTVQRYSGKKYSLTGTQYNECITATFDICKNDDIFDKDEMMITNDEYRDLMRWLNRREFLRFRVIGDDDDIYADTCYYNASFNVSKIKIGEILYGLRLTLETDMPFGYGEEQTVNITFDNNKSYRTVNNISDEIGSLYPTLIIVCNEDGNLTMTNYMENCTMAIKNCLAGETITVDGENQIITSDQSKYHNLHTDFNFEFMRLGRTLESGQNDIGCSLPCDVTIKYKPIIKDSV